MLDLHLLFSAIVVLQLLFSTKCRSTTFVFYNVSFNNLCFLQNVVLQLGCLQYVVPQLVFITKCRSTTSHSTTFVFYNVSFNNLCFLQNVVLQLGCLQYVVLQLVFLQYVVLQLRILKLLFSTIWTFYNFCILQLGILHRNVKCVATLCVQDLVYLITKLAFVLRRNLLRSQAEKFWSEKPEKMGANGMNDFGRFAFCIFEKKKILRNIFFSFHFLLRWPAICVKGFSIKKKVDGKCRKSIPVHHLISKRCRILIF
jgi:hypothetical protein